MNTELFWLTLTTLMTACFWIPYILDRIMVRGVIGALANPSTDQKPQSAWAERAKAAHANAIENLVVFGVLVLIANALGVTGGLVATAAVIYFWTRLVHFVVYALGIIGIRTVSFVVGFVAQVMVAIAILTG
ncbi:MAG: MAPEG family protein [Chloroflexota bacterium]